MNNFLININIFNLIVLLSICIYFSFILIMKKETLIVSSNLTVYYPLFSSILSVSIRFMGLVVLLILLLTLLNLLIGIPVINSIEILRFLYFIIFITLVKHSYDSLSHLTTKKN